MTTLADSFGAGSFGAPTGTDVSTETANTVLTQLLTIAQAQGYWHGDPAHPWNANDPTSLEAVNNAVKEYQRRRGLPTTGQIDLRTVQDVGQVGQYLGGISHPTTPTANTSSTGTATGVQNGQDDRYSPEDIAYYAYQAGFRGEGLRNIVAIALAESNGRGHAVGDSGQSHGLFQIYAPAHPQYDSQRLMDDPLYAAQAAYEISGGGKNFDPWTTWSHTTEAGRNNPAQQYLPVATSAVQKVDSGYRPVNATTSTGTTTAGGGSYSTGGDKNALPPNATPEQVDAYIRQHYPDVAAFMGDKQIHDILFYAGAAGLDETEIMAAIRNTNYWQTHGPSSRAFDQMLATDRAGATQLINQTRIAVDQEYQKQGIHKTKAELDQVTLAYIRGGWSQQDLTRYVANEIGKNPAEMGAGTSANDADRYLAAARAQGLPLSMDTARQWALDVAAGRDTDQGVQAKITALAKGRWQNDPDVLKHIEGGGTAADYFRPYQDAIANVLELNPESVDLINDPKYAAVAGFYDPAAKVKRSMTLGEAMDWARHQPQYASTHNYHAQAANFATSLLREFGAIA